MYNQLVKQLLSQTTIEDADILDEQKKYSVSDNFSTIEFYISTSKVSFKVYGDAYIVAMVKWLQLKLQNGDDIDNIDIESLVKEFDLPDVKQRNAIQLMDLIEKINDRKAI